MKIILGPITYPKSEAIIVPVNSSGVMTRGVLKEIVKDGWNKVAKEVNKVVQSKELELGDCFSTDSGRLKRRKCYRIYYGVVKRFPNDLVSLHVIRSALSNCLNQAIRDGIENISISNFSIGQGELNIEAVSRLTVEECLKKEYKIGIKIVDTNKEFVNNVKKLLGMNDECTNE